MNENEFKQFTADLQEIKKILFEAWDELKNKGIENKPKAKKNSRITDKSPGRYTSKTNTGWKKLQQLEDIEEELGVKDLAAFLNENIELLKSIINKTPFIYAPKEGEQK